MFSRIFHIVSCIIFINREVVSFYYKNTMSGKNVSLSMFLMVVSSSAVPAAFSVGALLSAPVFLVLLSSMCSVPDSFAVFSFGLLSTHFLPFIFSSLLFIASDS